MQQAHQKLMVRGPQVNDLPALQPKTTHQNSSEGDDTWPTPPPTEFFESVRQTQTPQIAKQQHVQIAEEPEIIPPPTVDTPTTGTLKKARSWHSLIDHKNEEKIRDSKAPQAISMETIMSPTPTQRNLSVGRPFTMPSCQHFYSGMCSNLSYCSLPPCAMKNFAFSETNQSNLGNEPLDMGRGYSNGEYFNYYNPRCRCCVARQAGNPVFHRSRQTPMIPAFSMACLGERPFRDVSRFSRTHSMRTYKSWTAEGEKKRLIRFGTINYGCSESFPTSPVRGISAKQVGPVGDTNERNARNTQRLKSVSFGRPSRFRFYLKELPEVTKILMDTEDRRIRTICDRFQCDMEVYSKVPKSGFLQYAIDITAPDSTSLYACSRNLDTALGWFLTAQLTGSRNVKY
ncbi:unnamed protein product [Mesocestoides corti]|uniref:Uncharacterized protein n=1 Tax=Mesocestoides corti TaxID=53468 RepID=A0A0R3U4K0_MESCO|nr:unnamed protein product [Mesocestoides corti]